MTERLMSISVLNYNRIEYSKQTIERLIDITTVRHEFIFIDNGTGIPDNIKSKIFNEGFFYGKSGNTGIGLYIIKRTIESYNGSVSVADNLPNGAVFVINLRKVISWFIIRIK